jgi:replicative DNA helicase
MLFMTKRVLPHDIDREKSVLSLGIIFPDGLEELMETQLEPGHFYSTANSYVYQSIMDLKRRNQPVDLISVVSKLKQDGKLQKCGGAAYVAGLTDDHPVSINPKNDAQKLIELYNLRKIIEVSQKYQNKAYSGNHDEVENLIDAFQSEILRIGDLKRQDEFKRASDLLFESMEVWERLQDHNGQVTGITSGFCDIDRLTCGFQNSDLIIIAARPSMGKTALAMSCILEGAKHGVCAGIFSLEMSGSQLINRMMSHLSGINLMKFRSGFSPDNWQAVTESAAKLHDLPIFIDDSSNLNIQQIRRRALNLKKHEDIQTLWIDYLGFIRGDSSKPRVYEVGEISRELKSLAKDLDMPVVLLCQLNRQCEQRDNKRPRMADLRESGDLEQDADVIAFLYRHEQYLKPKPEVGSPEYKKWHGKAELEFAKHRNGPTGTIFLNWNGRTTKFSNWVKIS